MTTKSRTNLIVFAKEPILGKVKTRLQRDLPAQKVLRIYKILVKNVIGMASTVRCDQKQIYYTGSDSAPFLKKFKRHFSYESQQGQDLGERLYDAFVKSCQNGFGRTIIIGTDCMTITKQDVETAFAQLQTSDCVLGPSHDGGYYLIGLKEPVKDLFQGVPWSTHDVFGTTISRAESRNMKVFLLDEREDVDDLESFQRLAQKKLSLFPSMLFSKFGK